MKRTKSEFKLPPCPYCGGTGRVKMEIFGISEVGDYIEARCPRCATTIRIDIGHHSVEGQISGTSGEDVSKVVRELMTDVDKMGDKIEMGVFQMSRVGSQMSSW